MDNKVIVLLPHFNNPEGLEKTFESLRNEKNFDVLLIDDGSDDPARVEKIVQGHSGYFPIEFIRLKKNQGITKTLNHGLKYIKEQMDRPYIARLDAGDVCLGNRFQKQVEFLEQNNDVYLIGSWVDYVDTHGEILYRFEYPTEHEAITRRMYLNNMFNHPAVMYRTAALETVGYYPENYPAYEDHAFFFKFIKAFRTANIPEVLLKYEVNPDSISIKHRKKQAWSRIKLLIHQYKFGCYPTYGLLRSIILYLVPVKLLVRIKVARYKRKRW